MFLGEVFSYGCLVKDKDRLTKAKDILINVTCEDKIADRLLFQFYNQQGNDIEALPTANKRTDAERSVAGSMCFLHVASPELLYTWSQGCCLTVIYVTPKIKYSLPAFRFFRNRPIILGQQLMCLRIDEGREYKSKVSTFCVPLVSTS